MANADKVKVVKGDWMGLTGTVVNVVENTVKMVPNCEPDMVGSFFSEPKDVLRLIREQDWLEDREVFEAKLVAATTYFGNTGQPNAKDVKRANDLLIKYRYLDKRRQHARNMARKITDPSKAFRRCLVFMAHPSGGVSLGAIFLDRCWELVKGE